MYLLTYLLTKIKVSLVMFDSRFKIDLFVLQPVVFDGEQSTGIMPPPENVCINHDR